MKSIKFITDIFNLIKIPKWRKISCEPSAKQTLLRHKIDNKNRNASVKIYLSDPLF